MRYYANGFTFKLEQLKDGWWSIYRLNEFTGEYMPQIQTFNLKYAKSYCDMQEPTPIPLKRI